MTQELSLPTPPAALGELFAAAEHQLKSLAIPSEISSWLAIGSNFLEQIQHPEWLQSDDTTLWSSAPLMLMEMPLCMMLIAGDMALEYTDALWPASRS
jgi:hypothetical protein